LLCTLRPSIARAPTFSFPFYPPMLILAIEEGEEADQDLAAEIEKIEEIEEEPAEDLALLPAPEIERRKPEEVPSTALKRSVQAPRARADQGNKN
jgi:hypothetical protein